MIIWLLRRLMPRPARPARPAPAPQSWRGSQSSHPPGEVSYFDPAPEYGLNTLGHHHAGGGRHYAPATGVTTL